MRHDGMVTRFIEKKSGSTRYFCDPEASNHEKSKHFHPPGFTLFTLDNKLGLNELDVHIDFQIYRITTYRITIYIIGLLDLNLI